jgi:hypothetical protein
MINQRIALSMHSLLSYLEWFFKKLHGYSLNSVYTNEKSIFFFHFPSRGVPLHLPTASALCVNSSHFSSVYLTSEWRSK